MAEPIRFVKDIGMFAFSRGRGMCRWQTPWCRRNCYNNKFYAVNPKLDAIDKADNDFWRGADSADFVNAIRAAADYEDVPRFRFSVRGEIWMGRDDVERVMLIMRYLPDTLFWIPTRAWQDTIMRNFIAKTILPLPNARVMASTDPSITPEDEKYLLKMGYSVLFTGDNDSPDQLLLTEDGGTTEKRTAGMYRCPKTWGDERGHCAVCTEGCFSGKSVAVHLKKHR